MKKGVKVATSIKNRNDHYMFCSECLSEVGRIDKHCWYCGCVLDPVPVGTNIDYVVKRRNDYREDDKTGWEDES